MLDHNLKKSVTTNKVLFCFDASRFIGGGHAYRCLALAEALYELGWEILIASSSSVEKQFDQIYKFNFIEIDFQSNFSINNLINNIEYLDLVVIDHYQLDINFEIKFKDISKNILVIDDLANRHHFCNYLIDQTLGRKLSDYNHLVPINCKLLLGSSFCLLRKQFKCERNKIDFDDRCKKLKNVLISFGASDPYLLTEKILLCILNLEFDLNLNIVLGKYMNINNLYKLEQKFQNIKILKNISNMAKIMAKSDLSIGAAGVSSWERCVVGLPSLVVVTADNQDQIAKNLHNKGAIKNFGSYKNISLKDLCNEIASLKNNPEKLNMMSQSAFELCDGNGVNRVLKELNL